jgi:riboflavin biosynthesis pyrimidine reductase
MGAKKMGSSLGHVDRMILTNGTRIPAAAILRALADIGAERLILLETGPQLTGQFLQARAIDELFLTLAPQVAGRDAKSERPGLVSGRVFAPDNPRWADLVSLRRGDSHLFLRYSFNARPDRDGRSP